jgi:hypothetical protein
MHRYVTELQPPPPPGFTRLQGVAEGVGEMRVEVVLDQPDDLDFGISVVDQRFDDPDVIPRGAPGSRVIWLGSV